MIEPNGEYETTRRVWRRIWSDADLQTQLRTRDYPRARAIRDRFVPFLPDGDRILEAGCGLGVEVVALAERGFRVIGLDYAVDALQRLKEFDPAASTLGGDVHALPFGPDTFGAYLSFGVLEHFRFGPEPALREAHRVLRRGGTLVLTVPAPNLVWRAARLRSRFRSPDVSADQYFETTYSARSLAALVRRARFEVLVCEPVSHEFTLWELGGPFRADGYYQTSALARWFGVVMSRVLPQAMSFATLIVARKTGAP
jgi:SAM-dependent methyltransferase